MGSSITGRSMTGGSMMVSGSELYDRLWMYDLVDSAIREERESVGVEMVFEKLGIDRII